MNYFLLVLKGSFMGLADLVPGVSGGTVALIVGVYERLIKNVGSVLSLRGGFRGFVRALASLEWGFLLSLLGGVALAILLGARVMSWLLLSFPVIVFSVFVGLILASVWWLADRLYGSDELRLSWLALGTLGGLVAALLSPASQSVVSTGFLFFSGLVAITAMLLPGVSGSYLLLILGSYEYVLGLLHHPLAELGRIGVFVLGCLAGALLSAKVIAYALREHHGATMSTLTGLMLGAVLKPMLEAWMHVSSANDVLFGVLAVAFGVLLFLGLRSLGGLASS